MSWLNSLIGQEKPKVQGATLGYNIDKKETVAEMYNMQKKMEKTTTRYIGELDKYREIAKFNKQLSRSYIANLDIMVDVSKVLNMYMETLEVIRKQISRAEEALGKPLDANELAYLSQITQDQIANLSKNFFAETGKLQSLFSKSPDYRAEANKLATSQAEFKNTLSSWAQTYEREKALFTSEAQKLQSQQGGKKKPRRPKVSKK